MIPSEDPSSLNDTGPRWSLETEFSDADYKCGARPGEVLRLRRELPVRDHLGNAIGTPHPAGGLWRVLKPRVGTPGILWMLDDRDELHTWDDSADLWNWFSRSTNPPTSDG